MDATINDLAELMIDVYHRACKDLGPDLCGFSTLDLMADNFPSIPLETLKAAMKIAGISTQGTP